MSKCCSVFARPIVLCSSFCWIVWWIEIRWWWCCCEGKNRRGVWSCLEGLLIKFVCWSTPKFKGFIPLCVLCVVGHQGQSGGEATGTELGVNQLDGRRFPKGNDWDVDLFIRWAYLLSGIKTALFCYDAEDFVFGNFEPFLDAPSRRLEGDRPMGWPITPKVVFLCSLFFKRKLAIFETTLFFTKLATKCLTTLRKLPSLSYLSKIQVFRILCAIFKFVYCACRLVQWWRWQWW